MIEVVEPGPLATVQDLGRTGWAALGVSRSGAADRRALRLGNRLVGNPATAASIEITFGGFEVCFRSAALIAVTGAPVVLGSAPLLRIGVGVPVAVPAGTRLVVGPPARGLRSYLAVRGGVAVEPVLGPRSTDTLAGLGPPRLHPGMLLPIGPPDPDRPPTADLAPPAEPPSHLELTVVPGPRHDWASLPTLLGATYGVGAASDRIGVRLAGPALARRAGELPPEGMVRGAIQVPPDGQPVLLLADHPVTGGYPVVAVVVDAEIDHAAQLRPGDTVSFRLRR